MISERTWFLRETVEVSFTRYFMSAGTASVLGSGKKVSTVSHGWMGMGEFERTDEISESVRGGLVSASEEYNSSPTLYIKTLGE